MKHENSASAPTVLTANPEVLAWFCIRSQPKHEHIAAANLRQIEGVEVFNPRLRLRKATQRGGVWFTESLFPNYLFARFILKQHLDQIRYTSGVNTVVRFGRRWPVIPDEIVDDLRQNFDECQLKVVAAEPSPGDSVKVVEGSFGGCTAVVLRVLSSRQRVQVLLDILGRATAVELSLESVVPENDCRCTLLAG